MTVEMRAVAELLDAMPNPDAEVRLRRQIAREAYARGRADGWRAGFERGARLLEAEWPRIVAPIARDTPDFAELERRRYGPGGREHFGDPRPGDYVPCSRAGAVA